MNAVENDVAVLVQLIAVGYDWGYAKGATAVDGAAGMLLL
jgi:hypothetical protein